MINLIFLFLLSTFAMAQKSSPVLDPNKYTVCAITINSDDEKKIFQDQAEKFPKKFNPVVELTDFSQDENWFEKACESKVKCDQLIISGHFGGEFFGSSGKQLSLSKLEKAGCSHSCPGILNQPHEVFLFGCNTLAEKEKDHRSPAEYLAVLLADQIPRTQAELIVESRYGDIGDSNKATMQRAFGGTHKQIYGFNSVGPSGKNVKQYLQNYFLKTNASDRLDKLSAMRMMNQLNTTNNVLAQSLKATAFAQCESSDLKDEVTKKICSLQDSRISTDKKIEVIVDALIAPNFLTYLPAINSFLKDHPVQNMTPKQQLAIKEISNNKVISTQIINLIHKTKSLSLLNLWANLAINLGMLERNDVISLYRDRIKALFVKPMTENEAQQICEMDQDLLGQLNLQRSEIKNKALTKFDIAAMGCLNSSDSEIYKEMIGALKILDKETTLYVLSLITDRNDIQVKLSPLEMTNLKKLFVTADPNDMSGPYISLRFFAKYYSKDQNFLSELDKLLKSPKEEVRNTGLVIFTAIPTLSKEQERFMIDEVSGTGLASYFDDLTIKLKSLSPEGQIYLEDKFLKLTHAEQVKLYLTMAKAGASFEGILEKIIDQKKFSLISSLGIKSEKLDKLLTQKFPEMPEEDKLTTINIFTRNQTSQVETIEKVLALVGNQKFAGPVVSYLESITISENILMSGLKRLNPNQANNRFINYLTIQNPKKIASQLEIIQYFKMSKDDSDKKKIISYLQNISPLDLSIKKAIKEAGIKFPPVK